MSSRNVQEGLIVAAEILKKRNRQTSSKILLQFAQSNAAKQLPLLTPPSKKKAPQAIAKTHAPAMVNAAFRNLVAPLQQPKPACVYEPRPNCILYVLHSSLPYSSNGYATRSHGMAKALVTNGVELHCFTRPGFPNDLYEDNKPPFETKSINSIDRVNYTHTLTITRHDFPTQHEYMKGAAVSIKEAILEHRPTAVVSASNHSTAIPAALACHELGARFIYEVRGFWEITRLSREPEFAKNKSFVTQVYLESETAKAADHVLTLTTPMAEELARRGVGKKNITLVPNSCDPSRFAPRTPSKELVQKYNIPENVPVIGYIGSFVQYEGLDDLAKACSNLHQQGVDFRLLLVGSENAQGQGQGPITQSILDTMNARSGKAPKLGTISLKDKLILPGRVPHDEVEDHYSLIDIAPFPRKAQPVTELVSPLKPLEAFAMQKSVIVSSVGAMKEMIIDGETGLVFEKGNIDDLTTKLRHLIENPSLRQQMGTSARKWVEKERTWEKTAKIFANAVLNVDKR